MELNRKAVESDLLIYVNLNLVPMDGGHKSVAVGLCGYKSLRAHHNPHTMRDCWSYMDPSSSALATSVERMGRLVEKTLDVFHIETTVNNRMFDRPLEFLHKNEDDWTGAERAAFKALSFTLSKVPQPARQAVFQRVPSPYGVTGVFAGECEAVHQKTLERCYAQYLVPVQGQADILVSGIPYISPYNVNAYLNPLLVQVMAQGYLFNLYKGRPLVRKGGTMIVFHPCSDVFDKEHHAPYIEFVHDVLPQTRDAVEMHTKFEEKFATNPAYIEMYRKGHAYHPAHPFYMWYWGEAGRQHLGPVLVFPEGTRSATGEIQDFKPLVGHLALVHGVDLLPVFLGGTHAAMPKGSFFPTRRELLARIGPPLCMADLRRLTEGMSPGDAAREVARIAREAVLALSEGKVLDLSTATRREKLAPEREHPRVRLFSELEGKFRAGEVEKPVSYYVSLGNDELAKWTVRVDDKACLVRPGKPENGQADCVLKTSPEIFAKIVRESYVPSPADFLSGAIKSNDVALLLTFQKVFCLDQPS